MSTVILGVALLLVGSLGPWVIVGPVMIGLALSDTNNKDLLWVAFAWLLGGILALIVVRKMEGTETDVNFKASLDAQNETSIRHYYARHYQPPRDDKKDTYQGDPWLSGGM